MSARRLRSLTATAIACAILLALGDFPWWVYFGVGAICSLVVE